MERMEWMERVRPEGVLAGIATERAGHLLLDLDPAQIVFRLIAIEGLLPLSHR